MKTLKIFEEFKQVSVNIDYVNAKMQEFVDLAHDIVEEQKGDSFTYEIVNEGDRNLLDIDLVIEGDMLDIEFELESLNLGMYSNQKHLDWTGNVGSIEEGMDKIEKVLYDHLGVQEEFNVVLEDNDNDIADAIIDDLLSDEEE
ncbi:MAG: hypothetical protein SLAVMIC_00577 [uncultured marine phage]|uniref:Uncharacterized protein n=1 Tax=uncultured marine phage TaxID=707152 RepID=A0A8D9CFE5_9VIRU|nr:MAG: hypothetical protein SLAVMIC_00577 [uncultured marine phage]